MKVCILAAGKGSRIRSFGGALHKALLPLGNMAVISRIIGQFPADASFVVAVGHQAAQLSDYLAIAHSDRDIELVPVYPYEGPGAGPGRSLLACKDALDKPFYLTACDTLIATKIPALTSNFMATQPVADPTVWCTVKIGAHRCIEDLYYKVADGTNLGFVGFAGVVDTDTFWCGLEEQLGVLGEYQVDNGFKALVARGITAVDVGWIDAGTEENYVAALPRYEANYTFYGKSTDVTYRLGDRVIKYFGDHAFTRARFARAKANPAFAEVIEEQGGFFSCRFIRGVLLSSVIGEPAYLGVLDWLQTDFWRALPVDCEKFDAACRQFYYNKTIDRLELYERRFASGIDKHLISINGAICSPVRQLVGDLPAEFWTGAIASTFHGDLHDENIMITADGVYVLIDWRQDFAGLADVGDRYYDLAKFFHTLDLSVATMNSGDFSSSQADDREISIEHGDSLALADARSAFWDFVSANGYDRRRVLTLNALIFISMAPLYEQPMADYLYFLGRFRLQQISWDAATGNGHEMVMPHLIGGKL